MEIKQRILQKATELFFKWGVRSVTMDDIAQALGISKKTIYQHFSDKDEIVYQVMVQQVQEDKCEMESLDQCSLIEKAKKFVEMIQIQLTGVNPSLFNDIRKYHPRAWQVFETHRNQFLLDSVRKDLVQGIEEGVFRSDIQVEVLARLRMMEIDMGFDTTIFPPEQFNIIDTQLAFFDHFMRGIFTEKGIKYYNQMKLPESF
jgi:TetR/AcrR family transcriptional regulator, cholesterol catabolism regulator